MLAHGIAAASVRIRMGFGAANRTTSTVYDFFAVSCLPRFKFGFIACNPFPIHIVNTGDAAAPAALDCFRLARRHRFGFRQRRGNYFVAHNNVLHWDVRESGGGILWAMLPPSLRPLCLSRLSRASGSRHFTGGCSSRPPHVDDFGVGGCVGIVAPARTPRLPLDRTTFLQYGSQLRIDYHEARMTFNTRRMGDKFACELTGLNLWEEIDAQTAKGLRALLGEHGVLIFRRQSLSENEFADFSALFGALELTVRRDWASNLRPEVGIISNLKDGTGKAIGGLGDGEVLWHSDQAYILNPATGAGLYAVEISSSGGATRWANLANAYEALPDRLKNAVDGKSAVFSYPKRLAGFKGTDRTVPSEMKHRIADVIHPIVQDRKSVV